MIGKIEPSETVMQGRWLLQDGRVVADDVCQRILALVRSCLIEVASDESRWEKLYRNPEDHRLWELTYPQGELHGGGPPQLRHLTSDEAKKKYGIESPIF